MGGSIGSLGRLAQVGGLAKVLRPAFTTRVVRNTRVDQHTRMLRSIATTSTARGVSPLADMAQQLADTQVAAARLDLERAGNAFDDRAVVSSNAAVVSGTAQNGTDIGSLAVQVNAIASTQTNLGAELRPTTATPVMAGSNKFSITTGNVTHLMDVDVGAQATNRETLYAVARRINGAGIGVTARVLDEDASVRLELTATTSGAPGAFTISDVTGNTVLAIGAGQVAVAGQDAEVAVDGATQTSSESSVSAQSDTVTLNVHQVSRDPVVVGIEQDVEAIVAATKGLAKKLDELADQIERRGGDDARSLRQALVEPIRRRAETLRQLGISLDSDSRVVVDEDALRAELQRDAAYTESRIGGPDGFAPELADALFGARGDPGVRAPRALAPAGASPGRVRIKDGASSGVLLNIGA